MTETRAPYTLAGLSESDLQAHIVKRLRESGWYVMVTSQDKATRRHVAGMPDVIAAKHDNVLFIECKTPTGRVRPAQVRFALGIAGHLGPHVHYRVMRWPFDVELWCGGGSDAANAD